ncbi:unnamed protein product [Phyllotreta striolata]|uniref:Uncharacterized protein n=1 Tax=Phyllotreta striolata TaxID=444603 RepID=A0A9N9TJR7_PHYSR|nr:unnamed protein product [Phyllotreta striolata]
MMLQVGICNVSKIKETEDTTQPEETTEVIVHIQPESKKNEQRPQTIRKTPSRVSNKIQEDFDKISVVDLEVEEPIPNPVQVEESKGKEQLIKEIAAKSRNKSTCLPSSLIFLGVFLMFASVVVMTYWLTKK